MQAKAREKPNGAIRAAAPGRRCLGVSTAVVAASSAVWILVTPEPAAADVFKDIGRFLGRPLGGFVEAATLPTVQQAEGSAHRIISDVDSRVSERVNQVRLAGDNLITSVNRATKDRVAQVDAAAEARLSQADGIMAARIAQVDSSANARLAQALGGLQKLEREAISGAQKVVANLDSAAEQRIGQVNDAITARITQVRGTVQDAIAQADDAARGRIDQLDEVAERRLGSVDVIASKLSLNLQVTLLKVGALLGMVAFLVFALRYLFQHVPAALENLKKDRPTWGTARRGALVSATSAGWILVHLLAGAVGVSVFGFLAQRLPVGPQKEAEALTAAHQAGLDDSYRALDFSRVRYHAAQLAILDPAGDLGHRAVQARAELIRTAFARPGLLASPEGVRELSQQIAEAELVHERAAPNQGPSPDVLVVTCYLKWQLARTRLGELDAVTLCARALEQEKASTDPFLLRPLGAQYVRLFLARRPPPYETNADRPYDIDELTQLARGVPEAERFAPLAGAMKYDELVLEVDRHSSNAYVALLEAHAELVTSVSRLDKKQKAPKYGANDAGLGNAERDVLALKQKRLDRAREVISAWRSFDASLEASPELGGTPLTLSVLTLNDALLSHALWFEAHPDALGTAPRVRDERDPAARVAMAPVRIAWARRYLVTLAPELQALVGHDESERFERYESAALEFQQAIINYRLAVAGSTKTRSEVLELRNRAALAAGALGLYTSEAEQPPTAFGLTLLEAPNAPAAASDALVAIQTAYDGVRLRLL